MKEIRGNRVGWRTRNGRMDSRRESKKVDVRIDRGKCFSYGKCSAAKYRTAQITITITIITVASRSLYARIIGGAEG
jgi:hypothetical protein